MNTLSNSSTDHITTTTAPLSNPPSDTNTPISTHPTTTTYHLPPREVTRRTTCRVCNSKDLVDLFSLGEQYVNDFVDPGKERQGTKAPIELIICRQCTLVQLRHTVPSDLLYTGHYWYRSGVTDTMKTALRHVVEEAVKSVELKEGDVVLDIGSNDGTLLRQYNHMVSSPKVVTVGVEPATNLVEQGREGIDYLIEDLWGSTAYRSSKSKSLRTQLATRKAKIITACGMLYDLEDPNRFVEEVAQCLAPDGVFIAQLMTLRNMLNIGDIGNLCHEHLEFYSLFSLETLLARHGLVVDRMDTVAVNGESDRFYIRHYSSERPPSLKFRTLLQAEVHDGYYDPDYYKEFKRRMDSNRDKVKHFIQDQVSAGKEVWVYGASTKGNTILQYYGLDKHLITAAADRSPEKWGKVTVGTGIPVVSEDEMRRANPPFLLVLPYAFLDEFMRREAEWRSKGGKFIVPLPSFRVV